MAGQGRQRPEIGPALLTRGVGVLGGNPLHRPQC
jgi:hypothetical protein